MRCAEGSVKRAGGHGQVRSHTRTARLGLVQALHVLEQSDGRDHGGAFLKHAPLHPPIVRLVLWVIRECFTDGLQRPR